MQPPLHPLSPMLHPLGHNKLRIIQPAYEDVGFVTVAAAAQGFVIREHISMYIYTADNILVVSE